MSSAQLDIHPLDEVAAETEAAAPFALKEQVAERLAAHRARRSQHSSTPVTPIAPPAPAKARAARIAAAVAERYAQSQTYRAFLAAEAERAIRQAEAAAEVAALSAQAVVDAQYRLLDKLDAELDAELDAKTDQWALTPPAPPQPAPVAAASPALLPKAPDASAASKPASSGGGLTVRLYEDAPRTLGNPAAASRSLPSQQFTDEAEGLALDEEIAFRQAPIFEEFVAPIDIPANLIEFPRQLVASRKARPRLAEGPLREDADHTPEAAQLRIFEVEAAQISTAPVVESVEPEWSSILLGALPAAAAVESLEAPFSPVLSPQTAPLGLRVMASIVDGCIILAGLLAFTAAFALTLGHLPAAPQLQASAQIPSQLNLPMNLQTAAISTVAVLGFLTLLYHLLFFTLAEATPGMRYARIGLCTFNDENPTRSAMRRRLFAMLLSACPMGLGFLWACLDEDRMGWHDRISRIYQRSY
jgi:uncharacterized RDD family membrane protein YckC